MSTLRQDLRYGLRMLRRNPGFTAVAVLTLALGSGANTAMFSVVNSVLLRPLPYPDPEQLVRLHLVLESGSTTSLTAAQTRFFTEHSSAFQSIAAYRGRGDLQLETGKGVEWVRTIRVSGPFFRTLGANPPLGRTFAPEEERLGGQQALVLSDALWRRVFGADAGIVGRQVALNGEGYTKNRRDRAARICLRATRGCFYPLEICEYHGRPRVQHRSGRAPEDGNFACPGTGGYGYSLRTIPQGERCRVQGKGCPPYTVPRMAGRGCKAGLVFALGSG